MYIYKAEFLWYFYTKEHDMIKINCETKDTIRLTDCIPFQGKLKKRTEQDIQELKKSLETEGLMMPFAIWLHDNKKYLLDGHGRKEALVRMAVDDATLLNVDWPCVFIKAKTEEEARKALLQITSSYGKITRLGVKQFTATIPDYVAPSIAKFVAKPKAVESSDKPVSVPKAQKSVIRIRVANERFAQVLDILKQFDFIEVL